MKAILIRDLSGQSSAGSRYAGITAKLWAGPAGDVAAGAAKALDSLANGVCCPQSFSTKPTRAMTRSSFRNHLAAKKQDLRRGAGSDTFSKLFNKTHDSND